MNIVEKILALKTQDGRDSSLARSLNLPYTTLNSWRRGYRTNPKITTLTNICSALGCSLSDLVDPHYDIQSALRCKETERRNAAQSEKN